MDVITAALDLFHDWVDNDAILRINYAQISANWNLADCRWVLSDLLSVSRQLEQQDSQNSGEKAEMLCRLSGLQEENTRLSWDKANLTEVLKRTQYELDLEKQANRY